MIKLIIIIFNSMYIASRAKEILEDNTTGKCPRIIQIIESEDQLTQLFLLQSAGKQTY